MVFFGEKKISTFSLLTPISHTLTRPTLALVGARWTHCLPHCGWGIVSLSGGAARDLDDPPDKITTVFGYNAEFLSGGAPEAADTMLASVSPDHKQTN